MPRLHEMVASVQVPDPRSKSGFRNVTDSKEIAELVENGEGTFWMKRQFTAADAQAKVVEMNALVANQARQFDVAPPARNGGIAVRASFRFDEIAVNGKPI